MRGEIQDIDSKYFRSNRSNTRRSGASFRNNTSRYFKLKKKDISIYNKIKSLKSSNINHRDQAAFRGHYERMSLSEAQGKIQWQRAVVNTLDILKKAGATQVEIGKAARHVKVMISLFKHRVFASNC